jgi:hypothetical protein
LVVGDEFYNIVAKKLDKPKLKELELDEVRMDAHILCGLITGHKDSLRSIRCTDVSPFKGSWDEVIRAMQQLEKPWFVSIDKPREDVDDRFSYDVLLDDPNKKSGYYDVEKRYSDPEKTTKSLLGDMLRSYQEGERRWRFR